MKLITVLNENRRNYVMASPTTEWWHHNFIDIFKTIIPRFYTDSEPSLGGIDLIGIRINWKFSRTGQNTRYIQTAIDNKKKIAYIFTQYEEKRTNNTRILVSSEDDAKELLAILKIAC